MTEINKLIEDTERLLAAATPGPWVHNWVGDCIMARDGVDDDYPVTALQHHSRADGDLMAHAPTALRALVDEVKRLRQQVAKLEFDRTTQPNADWERNSVSVDVVCPQLPVRVCKVCCGYPARCDEEEQGEHHPACKHAPPNPKNAGPRYRSPAVYEGNVSDSNGDPV